MPLIGLGIGSTMSLSVSGLGFNAVVIDVLFYFEIQYSPVNRGALGPAKNLH